ncbi:MAG: lamin tail domain-containing protein [Christensenellales bacterium]
MMRKEKFRLEKEYDRNAAALRFGGANKVNSAFKKAAARRFRSLACALMLALSLLLSSCDAELPLNSKTTSSPNTAGVMINEVVSSNRYSMTSSDATTPDWVELYNYSDAPVNLEGFGLTDNTKETHQFKFPSVTIQAKGYLVVYCSGKEDTKNADGILRAGFKLSSEGETLALTGADNVTVQALDFPSIPADVSYGVSGNGYLFYAVPTPGAINSGATSNTGEFAGGVIDSPLVINEYMASNSYSVADSEGDRSGWVEIRNTGSEAVNLRGYGLSDSEDEPRRWVFPDRELGAGEVLLVFLSGKNKVTESGEFHASFSLGSGDTVLMLTEEHGKAVDRIKPEELNGSISEGRNAENQDEWYYYPVSTPGSGNTLKGFSALADAENALPDVYISEVKAIDRDGSDWIELYNGSDKSVDLTGYGLSDTNDDLYRFRFDGVTIDAGEYVVVECVGPTGKAGKLKASFALSVAGENIYLGDAAGRIVDHMNSGVQSGSISAGRATGSSKKLYFADSTKGSSNDSSTFAAYAKTTGFSVPGGYVSSGSKVELYAGEGETIYYTVNGSEPTQNSTKYTGPITIKETTPLRAKAYGDNKVPSAVVTETYIVGAPHALPVISLNMNPDDFNGETNGIYAKGPGYDLEDGDGSDYAHTKANYWQDWERKTSFAFYEADGTKGVEFNAGIRIFGQFSREEDQKSFSIHLRGEYGLAEVTYPFFRDYDVTTFSSLVLRSSGQDWDVTKIKDAFIHQITKDTMDLDYMEYRPCVVYINGDYWGIYNIREKENESYVTNHYPEAQEGKVDLVKGDKNVQAGSNEEWIKLREYIRPKVPCWNGGIDLINNADVMAYIEERVDLKNFMDWIAIEVFSGNTDTGNIRHWRYEGGKWRHMLFDLDWAFQTNGYNTKNFLEDFFNPNGHGSGDRFFSHMQMAVFYNNTWRKEFIELYAGHMKTTFKPERLHALIDAMAAEIRPEMARNIERWGRPVNMEKWEQNIEDLKTTVTKRWDAAKKEIKSLFDLSDARMNELFGG